MEFSNLILKNEGQKESYNGIFHYNLVFWRFRRKMSWKNPSYRAVCDPTDQLAEICNGSSDRVRKLLQLTEFCKRFI
jgi:hypothetical protein